LSGTPRAADDSLKAPGLLFSVPAVYSNDTNEILSRMERFLSDGELPSYDGLISLCNAVTSVLETEDSSYRPYDSSGSPGGLLDFSSPSMRGLPVVVVPDLHARGRFLLDAMYFRVDSAGGRTVIDLLSSGEIIVCCVGDIFHSESRARKRWDDAYQDFRAYYYDGEPSSRFLDSAAMNAEMRENFSLLQMIFLLKLSFPKFFHVLKGNHENVKNATYSPDDDDGFGNRAFRKFCEEGLMCAEFIRGYYDDLLLHCVGCFERALPLCLMSGKCVVSHAEPRRAFRKDEIVGGMRDDNVVFGLTWTANGDAAPESVSETVRHLYRTGNPIADMLGRRTRDVVWFGGHRPIDGRYAERQGGLFVQIHNPSREFVSLVLPSRKFNPETDIFDVG